MNDRHIWVCFESCLAVWRRLLKEKRNECSHLLENFLYHQSLDMDLFWE